MIILPRCDIAYDVSESAMNNASLPLCKRAATLASIEMAALGRQMQHCTLAAGRLFRVRAWLEQARAYPSTHMVTTLLLSALVLEAGLSWL